MILDLNTEGLSATECTFISTAYKLMLIREEKTIAPRVMEFVSCQLSEAFCSEAGQQLTSQASEG